MGKYKVFLLDEIQMLSTAAWNAMLKILEEPPEYVIFIFCTTDPQKILGTIMSRVQRFNFARISSKGITERLEYIIVAENKERQLKGLNTYSYAREAIEYIARLAQGGMRDSITILEKCIDYSPVLSLDNVLKATSGGITEDTLLQLLKYMLNCSSRDAILYFESIYASGIDISLFLKLWTAYLQNCVKYIITQESEITTLSNVTISWLDTVLEFLPQIKNLLLSVMEIRNNLSSDDMKVLVESWIIGKCN